LLDNGRPLILLETNFILVEAHGFRTAGAMLYDKVMGMRSPKTAREIWLMTSADSMFLN
jgi:hypothetical protein